MGNFKLEFYTEPSGRQPAKEWLHSLDRSQRRAVGVAMFEFLEKQGVGVCDGVHGKQLGQGLFELRVAGNAASASQSPGGRSGRSAGDLASGRIMLRVWCHAQADKVVLILGGYDKSKDPSSRRQQHEIKSARDRLAGSKRSTNRTSLER